MCKNKTFSHVQFSCTAHLEKYLHFWEIHIYLLSFCTIKRFILPKWIKKYIFPKNVYISQDVHTAHS